MEDRCSSSRRLFMLGGLVLGASAFTGVEALAGLIPTPRQTTGPFYPDRLPLDSDNDLAQVGNAPQRAAGTLAHVFGRVLDPEGRPVRGARVEIWQCDAFGRYHHPRAPGHDRADPNFQGFGRMTVADDGAFRFRTIEPVPYPGRAPHIHFAVSGPGFERLTTQMYLAGHPLNARDFVLGRVADPRARESLMVRFAPAPEIEPEAKAGRFDIVLGRNAFRE